MGETCGGIFGGGRHCDRPATMTFDMPGAHPSGLAKLHLCDEHGNEFQASLNFANFVGDASVEEKIDAAITKYNTFKVGLQFDEATLFINGEAIHTQLVPPGMSTEEFAGEFLERLQELPYIKNHADIAVRSGRGNGGEGIH